MGIIYTFIAALLFSWTTSSEVPYGSVEAAFASGDAAKIVSYGKDKILLNVLDKDGAYSQSQATQILKDFFVKKPASSFKFSVKSGPADSPIAVGTYSSRAESFRVTVKWAKVGSDYKIESISIGKS